MKKDTTAIYSGGMDSFTLVNELHAQGRLHSCLSFNYGQRHSKELDYAARVCSELSVVHTVVDLSTLQPLLKGSALTDSVEVPEGHYAADNMKLTVVPNRNMIMLSIAIAHAVANKLDVVACGVHAGDHTIYPDCRPLFIDRMNKAALVCDWHPATIYAPYLHETKVEIIARGVQLGLDYSKSWTCYKGMEKACGVCGSCQERLEGFAANGIRDPLEYMAGAA